ncbi:MAG TPA: type II secretion system secretin GspD [Nevskiales bacterium]|nr:type II secretion system secretin GspD [Nevskiales bacterium]
MNTSSVLRVFRHSVLAFALSAPLGITAAQETATLNFEDAEISAVIATVSEITGRNFIVDPRVKGKVTVLSPTPLAPDAVYEAFLSILQVHGFAAVPVGDVIKIVPEAEARQGGARAQARIASDDIVTRVIAIENVSAVQLVPILRPLVPQYGHLAAYPGSNMLIISDRASNVDRIESIIRRIDQTSDREIEVIKLENAAAAEVVRMVTSLTQETKKADPTAAQVSVVADERTNSVLIGGDKSQRLAVRAMIAQLDTATDIEGYTQVIYLRYAEAEQLAPVLEGYAAQASQTAAAGGAPGAAAAAAPANRTGGQNEYRIIPEPGTNSLVITAPPKTMRALRSVIEQLDIRRAQVLVEAIIAEVSESKSRELGVDLAAFEEGRIAFASILNPSTLTAIGTAAASGSGASALGLLSQGITAGVGGESGGTSIAAIIKALAGDGKTNILSTPSLVTMDNEEAEISVGQEVPFLTGSFTNTGTGGGTGTVNPFQTIERKDVGLTLKITPQINEGDNIKLKIEQEVSSLTASALRAVDLITNKRTLNTSVSVGNGDILVLGGLIDDNVTENRNQVPVLGSIPFFGELFKSRKVTKDKRNLMVFIRPTVLREPTVADYYTRRKYDYVRGIQLEQQQRGIPLMGQENVPVTPPIEQLKKDSPQPTRPPAAGTTAPAKPATQPAVKP